MSASWALQTGGTRRFLGLDPRIEKVATARQPFRFIGMERHLSVGNARHTRESATN